MAGRVRKFLVVSIDSWRYDALARNNPDLNTPKFDWLTKDYTLAERFFVTAPATRPSHTSLFTGLYPFEHGVFGQNHLKPFGGIPNVFDVFSQAGYRVSGRSQRPEVFRFLGFDRYINSLDPGARDQHLGSLEPVLEELAQPPEVPQFCFLHFWYTHGGYGMGGMRRAPDLRGMVAEGRAREALRYYFAAAVHVQEFLLAEILKRIDLDTWAVFILGDHGEGFCREVMSHGEVLHPNLVHVPLLAHVPFVRGMGFPGATISMVDLFPTLLNLAGLDGGYKGYGRDLLGGGERTGRYVLTELDSLYGDGFLKPQFLNLRPEQVTSPSSVDDRELDRDPRGVRMWSVTDGIRLYREEEGSGRYLLQDLWSGQDLPCPDPAPFREIHTRLLQGSAYRQMVKQEASEDEARILKERLKALGYL